jgi:hypothetical protein
LLSRISPSSKGKSVGGKVNSHPVSRSIEVFAEVEVVDIIHLGAANTEILHLISNGLVLKGGRGWGVGVRDKNRHLRKIPIPFYD